MQQVRLLPRYLGQKQTPTTVLVSDSNGKPVEGAEVQMIGGRGSGEVLSETTDSDGKATFPYLAGGDQELHAIYQGLVVSKTIPGSSLIAGDTIFITFPISIQGSVFKPVDFVILGSAAALTLGGIYGKVEPLKVAGEILFGAAAFTIIYRLA